MPSSTLISLISTSLPGFCLASALNSDLAITIYVLVGILAVIFTVWSRYEGKKRAHEQLMAAQYREMEETTAKILDRLEEKLARVPRDAAGKSFVALREYTPDDLVNLQDLEHTLRMLKQIPMDAPTDAPKDSLEASLFSPRTRFLVATEEATGRIIGCCGTSRDAYPAEYNFSIIYLFVSPPWQRKGVGSVLMLGNLAMFQENPTRRYCPVLHLSALAPTQKLLDATGIKWSNELETLPGYSYRFGQAPLEGTTDRQAADILTKHGIPFPQPLQPPAVLAGPQR